MMAMLGVSIGLSPFLITVSNEGLVRDSLLKMERHPGVDWHPGKGATAKVSIG